MDLKGKKALIMGLANERSIAWGVAQSLKEAGAEIGLTYIDALEKRVRPLGEQLGSKLLVECDVNQDAHLKNLSEAVKSEWSNQCDILVHSIAFADREDLAKDFSQTSRAGFLQAMEVSAFSLIACANALRDSLIQSKASVITMSYYGAEKVVPHYNVMGVAKAALEASVRYLAADMGQYGVRVNAISAGPIRTLAASGVKDFKSMLNLVEEKAPLRRNVDIQDVGRTALYLGSELASGVTGETLYVDSGYNIMGM